MLSTLCNQRHSQNYTSFHKIVAVSLYFCWRNEHKKKEKKKTNHFCFCVPLAQNMYLIVSKSVKVRRGSWRTNKNVVNNKINSERRGKKFKKENLNKKFRYFVHVVLPIYLCFISTIDGWNAQIQSNSKR